MSDVKCFENTRSEVLSEIGVLTAQVLLEM